MKIVNICLAGSYNIGWGYHDNMISKYQKDNGNDVTLVTSRFINDKKSEGYLETDPGVYCDGKVKVIRLEHGLGKNMTKIFRHYKNLYEVLESESPEFIFIHGCQFIDIIVVCRYLNSHENVRVCVDNHADYTNSAVGLPGKLIHKTLWKYCANKIDKYADTFYGVLPIRCRFLHEMYGIDEKKIKLLVMGADDEYVTEGIGARKKTRESLGILDDDFVVITGGKIDLHKKETLELMKAINVISNDNIKLVVFGSVGEELREEFNSLLTDKIIYKGWVDLEEQYNLICAADLAIYPGRHSVIWEQTVGCGVPAVFRDLEDSHHVDVGGNCIFIRNTSSGHLKQIILDLYIDKQQYNNMKKAATTVGIKEFSYKEIAKKSIEV